jgi:hypothetical protein
MIHEDGIPSGRIKVSRARSLTAIAIDGKWLRGVADGQVELFAALLAAAGLARFGRTLRVAGDDLRLTAARVSRYTT